MALDPESYLSTPSNYASPQQLAQVREIAAALMKPQSGPMQSWTQPAAQIVNALLGVKMQQGANASERANAAGGLPGLGSLTGQPGPAPQLSTAPTGDEYADASNYVKQAEGFDRVSKWDYHQYTSGYGTKEPGGAGIPISQDEAQRRFDNEFGPTYQAVRQRFPNANPDQLKALSSLTYNAGPGWMQGSGLSQAVDAGDWPTAARHMLTYNRAGGAPNAELAQRRQTDAQMLLSGGRPTQVAEGGSVRMDAPPSVPAAGMSFGSPSSPAGAQTQPPVSPTGQGPQGASASPQGQNAGPPPEVFRQGLITPQDVYRARIADPQHAFELEKMWREQQMPQIKQFGDSFYSYIPAHPEIPPVLVPQPSELREGGGEGIPKYPYQARRTPQGFVQSPVPSAAGPSGTPYAGPAGAGGYTGGGAPTAGAGAPPTVGTGAQPPTDFGSATQAAIDLKAREADASTTAQENAKLFGSQFKGRAGLADVAAQQKQNLNTLLDIVNDKNDPLITGPGGNAARFVQRVATQMGGLVGADQQRAAAAPREVFDMVIKRVLADQLSGIRSMSSETGEQGGRILKSFYDAEIAALPSADDSLPGIRAKLNILDRGGDYLIKWGRMADQYVAASPNHRLDENFHSMMLGEMSRARLIPPGGGATSDFPAPPDAAVQYLKANPNLRNSFEDKYGISAAEKALRGQ